MGKFSILLCDSDEVYIKRLAAGLQRQFRDRVSVRTCSEPEQAEGFHETDLLLASREPGVEWRRHHPRCICLWLDEDGAGSKPEQGMKVSEEKMDVSEERSLTGTDGTSQAWKDSVFKYQSVSRMARVLQQYFPVSAGRCGVVRAGTRQRWYGVVSPARHESMLPFACSLAGELGRDRRVLLIIFMEFSGLYSLLELEEEEGLEDFLLRLRQREPVERIPFPKVQALPGFDLLRGPANPMVLYELSEYDMSRFMERIQCCTEYDAVVWAAGNMLQGIREMFSGSEQIFTIEKTDHYSRCCQQEFEQFFDRIQQGRTDSLVHVCLPVNAETQTGNHLLWQWEHSIIGEEARRCLKGEESDGAVDRTVAKNDFRTVGHEW